MDAYHPGSLAVQERIGVRNLAEHVGRSVGPGIRPVAAAFLEAQPMLVIGAADAGGQVWASLLTGPPGFARSVGTPSHAVGCVESCGPPPEAERTARITVAGLGLVQR
ncbi:pyridoxamine 5'-phosphate oxidase family protein, partial [Streptomyces cinereoruber]